MKIKKFISYILMILLFITSLPNVIIASDLEYSNLNNIPAYYLFGDETIEELDFNNHNNDIETILNIVLNKQKNGSKIIWDITFLEDYVEKDFPNIYYQIKEYNNKYNMLKIPVHDTNTPSLYSSTKTQKFSVTATSLLGQKLYSLESNAYWSWTGNYINNVSITDNIITHDPMWNKGTIVGEVGNYSNNKDSYSYLVEGHIKSKLPFTEGRPLLGYELNPNQGYYTIQSPGN